MLKWPPYPNLYLVPLFLLNGGNVLFSLKTWGENFIQPWVIYRAMGMVPPEMSRGGNDPATSMVKVSKNLLSRLSTVNVYIIRCNR